MISMFIPSCMSLRLSGWDWARHVALTQQFEQLVQVQGVGYLENQPLE